MRIVRVSSTVVCCVLTLFFHLENRGFQVYQKLSNFSKNLNRLFVLLVERKARMCWTPCRRDHGRIPKSFCCPCKTFEHDSSMKFITAHTGIECPGPPKNQQLRPFHKIYERHGVRFLEDLRYFVSRNYSAFMVSRAATGDRLIPSSPSSGYPT